MRLKNRKTKIDYGKTKDFFKKRAEKYCEESPYCTTMYQDNNKEIVEQRNIKEQGLIIPLLVLDSNSKILDVACGIGRWGDAIKGKNFECYYGIDFSQELIEIARKRNTYRNYFFDIVSATEIESWYKSAIRPKFNRIIISGLLLYLNDIDVSKMFNQLITVCEDNSIIYIREPIGLEERLTLKDYYSEELETEYNAIYRTIEEYKSAMDIFIKNRFVISEEGFLFKEDETLNNRKETAQYYFVLKNNI